MKVKCLFLLQVTIISLSVTCITATPVEKMETKPEDESGEILSKEHLFQDIFAEQLAPQKIQFGHVFENPSDWEQRFEERDFSKNRHQGKVKWGNEKGAYGEHYWDLNH